MMNGEAVKELAERFRQPMEIGDVIAVPAGWGLHDPESLIKPGPTPDALKVYSLGALRDYLKNNRDGLPLDKLVVHVVSPQIVRLLGPIQERARNREAYVEATATNLTDNFLGTFMAHETFIVGLQTRFIVDENCRAVLKLIGNIKSEKVATSADDGYTQTVSAKAGVVLQTEASVPNPVGLTPFRTFREVRQPSSLFVLRAKQGHAGGLPEVGLFEADGGAWRLDAVEAVYGWLKHELPDTVAVLG